MMCPTPQLRPAAELGRKQGGRPDEQNLPLPLGLPGLWQRPRQREGPASGLGFSLGPRPTPPGSKVGLGEAEDESGLWDQSVQRCFSCARASSVLVLGSEVGRASQDTDPRLKLGLGRGAPGSGKHRTLLRNNSGGGNGSQRFLWTQEARGLHGGTWAPG